ncbi:MAG: hypothetical protein Q9M35_05120 [Rhodothermus sp.]|nr:hypothetical protein [Rhodothermus sp.]
MAILTVPKVLREKLGEAGVEALIALLNEAVRHERNNLLGIVEERFARRVTEEGARLERQIQGVESKLERQIAVLDKRLTEEVAKLETRLAEVEMRLRVQISQGHTRLIRWMFVFWAGQIGVIVALFALLR